MLEPTKAFSISDDSQYLVTEHWFFRYKSHIPSGYWATANLWEVSTGKDLGPLGEPSEWKNGKDERWLKSGEKLPLVGAAPEGFRVRRLSHGRVLMLPRYLPPPQLKVMYTPGGTLHKYQSDGTTPGGVIRLLDAATGKELHRLTEFQGGYIWKVVLSPDGNRLAAIGRFEKQGKLYTLLLWDISRWRAAAGPLLPPSAEDLKRLWADLARPDTVAANRAMSALAASPEQAVALFRKRLWPIRGLDQVPQLIADLDSAEYDTRERASRKLKSLGDLAEPLLRKALQERPSAEARRRINDVLESLKGPLPPEHLRYLRSVDVLEHLATPQARQVLQGVGVTTGGRK